MSCRPRVTARPALAAVALLLVTVSGCGPSTATGSDPGGGSAPGTGSEQGAAPLTLALPDPSVAASCVRLDVEVLRDMSPAFAGTVSEVDAERVVLDVDRWYRGGEAEQVVLARPDPHSSAALEGVEFEPGGRYLVTAADGTVNGCGFSGPATPELEAAYEQAF